MARVKFTKDYDYKPTRQTTIAYKAGMEVTVRQECAEQAIAAGAATSVERPPSSAAGGKNDGAEA